MNICLKNVLRNHTPLLSRKPQQGDKIRIKYSVVLLIMNDLSVIWPYLEIIGCPPPLSATEGLIIIQV